MQPLDVNSKADVLNHSCFPTIAKGQSGTLENRGKNLLGQLYESNIYKKNVKQNIRVKSAITKSLDSIRCRIANCITKKLVVISQVPFFPILVSLYSTQISTFSPEKSLIFSSLRDLLIFKYID